MPRYHVDIKTLDIAVDPPLTRTITEEVGLRLLCHLVSAMPIHFA